MEEKKPIFLEQCLEKFILTAKIFATKIIAIDEKESI